MAKDKEALSYEGHIVAVPYPTQGHINPLLQLCKRVSSTRPSVKTTFARTAFSAAAFPPTALLPPSLSLATISDGFDALGFSSAPSIDAYLAALEAAGRRTLSDLIAGLSSTPTPATCVVYDAFMPWALDVAKSHGLPGVAFFTQPCTVNYMYYLLRRGEWSVEEIGRGGALVKVPGMETEMGMEDMPSFVGTPGSYPAYFEMLLNQYANIHSADCVLVNTFYELEPQVVDSMSKLTPLLPIGPTIPSFYLDQQDPDDTDYGLHLFNFKPSTTTAAAAWLSSKPPRSVIYVSFGSLSAFTPSQIKEVAFALQESERDFLWALRAVEQPKLPEGIVEEMTATGKGMLVEWCTQLQVLANDAVGCFLTHCGWNSTQEALSVGVPMVAIPQWTDQPTNAKLVEDVWKVGRRAKPDGTSGIVTRERIGCCIREVMDEKEGGEIRANARKWKDLAKKAFARGGSSDRNIDIFLSKCVRNQAV